MKRFFGTPATDYLPALGLLAVTLIYLATAYDYSPDARAVPAGVAWVMLVLVFSTLSRVPERASDCALMRWLNPAGDPAKQESGQALPAAEATGCRRVGCGFCGRAGAYRNSYTRCHSTSFRRCIFRVGGLCWFASESAPPPPR